MSHQHFAFSFYRTHRRFPSSSMRLLLFRRFAVTRNMILVTGSATCIPADIIPIEQTKERLHVGKQSTAVSRCYRVTLIFSRLTRRYQGSSSSSSSLLFFSSSFTGLRPFWDRSLFSFLFVFQLKNRLHDMRVYMRLCLSFQTLRRTTASRWRIGPHAKRSCRSCDTFSSKSGGIVVVLSAIMSKTVVRKTKSGNFEYRGNSKFPAGVYTIHPPSVCDHTLKGRPIHLRGTSAYEGKEVIDYTHGKEKFGRFNRFLFPSTVWYYFARPVRVVAFFQIDFHC